MPISASHALAMAAVSNNPEWVQKKYPSLPLNPEASVFVQGRFQIIDRVTSTAMTELEKIENQRDKTREKKKIFQALTLLKQSHLRQTQVSWIASLCQKIWWRLRGAAYFQQKMEQYRENQDFVRQLDAWIREVRPVTNRNRIRLDDQPESHSEALCRFTLEFERHLGAAPPDMEGGEIRMLFLVSERIWNSKQVQEAQQSLETKYGIYKELMIEYAIGSHVIFFESLNEATPTLCETAIKQIGEKDERGSVRRRGSTHYGKVGSEQQYHIEGSRFPELLFKDGRVAITMNNNEVVSYNGKAAYFKDLPSFISYQPNITARRVTWLQNERTPDGPGRIDWLFHRYRDTPLYWVLKNVFKRERCQVGPYISSAKGRGVPDTTPVIIEQARPAQGG